MKYSFQSGMLVLSMLTTTLFTADDSSLAPASSDTAVTIPEVPLAPVGTALSYLQEVTTTDGYTFIVDPALLASMEVGALASMGAVDAQTALLASKSLMVIRHKGGDGQYCELFLHNRIGDVLVRLRSLRHPEKSVADRSIRRICYQEGGVIPRREDVIKLFDVVAGSLSEDTGVSFRTMVSPSHAGPILGFANLLDAGDTFAMSGAPDISSPPPARAAIKVAPTPPGVTSYTVSGARGDRGQMHWYGPFASGGYELVWSYSREASIDEIAAKACEAFGPGVMDVVSLVIDGTPVGSSALVGVQAFSNLKKLSARDCGLVQVHRDTLVQPLESLDLSDNRLIMFDLNAFAPVMIDDVDDDGEDMETPIVAFLQDLVLENNKIKDMPLNLDRATSLRQINLLGNGIAGISGASFPEVLTQLCKISFSVNRIGIQDLIGRGGLGTLMVRQMWQLIRGAEKVWNENEWLQERFSKDAADLPAEASGAGAGDVTPARVRTERFFAGSFEGILDAFIRNYVATQGDSVFIAREMRARLADARPLKSREIADFFTKHGSLLQGVLDNNTRVTITLDGVKPDDRPLLDDFLADQSSGCVVIYR